MNIEFMYIRGISESNTLYFATLQEKNTYFSNAVANAGKIIEYSFFPPKYSNELKVATTDVDLESNYNYLRFLWRGRYYYYFIDSIEYISEDVVQINIIMDTVMTYYHDIIVAEGTVERKHINRFINIPGATINRNYIRENLSDGLFKEENKMYIVRPDSIKWLIVKSTAELRVGTNVPRASYIKAPIMDKEVPCAYGLYIGPLDNKNITVSYNDSTPDTYTYPYINLIAGIKDNRVVDIYACPFNPINELEYTPGDSSVNGQLRCYWSKSINADDIAPFMTNNAEEYTGLGVNGKFARITQKVHSYDIPINPINFTKNTQDNVIFDVKYIPCLLDENYMRLVCGSENANVSYPVHTTDNLNQPLRFKFCCNIEDGSRTYVLYNPADSSPDRYSCITIDSNILSMSLANDPWKDYQANIKGRLFSVGMETLSSGFNSFVDVASIKAGAKIKSARIKNDTSAWDKRAKRNPRLKKKYANRVADIEMDAAIGTRGALADIGKGLISSMGSEISTAANAMWSAPTAKQLGNLVDGDTAYQMSIWAQWSIVEDIQFVGMYYHKYGNLVNVNYRDLDLTPGWYNYFHNRKYFNYMKFANLTVSINALCEQEVIGDIEDRFVNGMTMWRTDNPIGTDYVFDNVELIYS